MESKAHGPCSPTCFHHVTHPCEKCGRILGVDKPTWKQLETKLAEARAEIERLSSRDGNAKHELVYYDGDNPFAREKLEHIDFGVCDNQYVLESHLLNNTLEKVKAKDKLIEQMREALKAIDAIGDENGNASRVEALRCFSIARAALAAEGGE